ncbi:MAG: alpha-amylase [Aquificales bacterium]|nr:alpha-amylase [Aquificales bacterium]
MLQWTRFASLIVVLLVIAGCQQGVSPTPVSSNIDVGGTVVPLGTAVSLETAVLPTATFPPTPTSPPIPFSTAIDNPAWWDESIFYEIFVRSFADSDGDGVGDINGLIENLDYLNDGDPHTNSDLGITGIWLMPIMQSPSYHGYDTVDYYQVDDEYGSNEDFKRLVEEANDRGIRVIVDLVMNHTSDQHPWFQEARDPASAQRDWYIWQDEAPVDSNYWHQDDDGSYYYGYFWGGMPDLNYENPEVTAVMQEIIRFWLDDMGADGFRLDAIKHLIEDGRIVENTPATHTWLQQDFYPYVKDINPQALTVGEIWSTPDDIVPYIGDEVDIAFEFSLADAILESAVSERKVHVERAQQTAAETYPAGQFATFLANHDQNRARSRLLSDEQAKVAATLQLMSPGVPFIYYGEEIGMQGEKPDENIRRPMQWHGDGGFSTGEPWQPYFEDYQERHVSAQSDDPDSLLNHYRALVQLRNTYPALRSGGWTAVPTDNSSLYAFLRTNTEESILVLVNLGRKLVDSYTLTLPAGVLTESMTPVMLMGEGDIQIPALNDAHYQPITELLPYSSTIIRFHEDSAGG